MSDSITPQSKPKGRKFLLLVVVAFLIGAMSTGHWLGSVQFPELTSRLFSLPALLAGLCCVVLTSLNLLLRWSRWHFLIRRFSPHLVTRDSLAVYLATLPALLSPFFVAELGRVFLIRRRFQTPASYLVRIWFIERYLDFCVVSLALLYALAQSGGDKLVLLPFPINGAFSVGLAVLLIAAAFLLFFLTLRRRQALLIATSSLLLTAFAWALPIAALFFTFEVLGAPVTWLGATRSFAEGTLLGGLTGLPLGVFVTGSTMIEVLVDLGVKESTGVLGVLVYRSGTAYFAVLLGLVSLVVFRKRLLGLLRGVSDAHFDEIASEYEGEIPDHVRARLLDKKIDLIQRTLASHGISTQSRGLDLGCGQGWYLAELRKAGYSITGTDYSQGQLDRAELHLRALGLDLGDLVRADAQQLPFFDASYDFVYSVNAIHHILEEGAQHRTLKEIVRVLRPGGVFLLHEINTYNPVFRWYMGYLFPLLKKIDEGNEEWILPTALPDVAGASWEQDRIAYFTFLPDFVPQFLLRALAPLEGWLERSGMRRMSAHYQACLVKLPITSRSVEP